MPLYEYECESCGCRFEVIQKFSDAPVSECTTCGGPVRKLLSSPAIQFKGTGWYVTDYARKNSIDERVGEGGSAETSKNSAEKPAKSSSDTDSAPSKSTTPLQRATHHQNRDSGHWRYNPGSRVRCCQCAMSADRLGSLTRSEFFRCRVLADNLERAWQD